MTKQELWIKMLETPAHKAWEDAQSFLLKAATRAERYERNKAQEDAWRAFCQAPEYKAWVDAAFGEARDD